MNVLNLRVIVNSLAALVGAMMLVPAAYSPLTGSDEAWIFWLSGMAALAPGAALFSLTRTRRSSHVSRQSIVFMVVVCWLGVGLVGAAPYYRNQAQQYA